MESEKIQRYVIMYYDNGRKEVSCGIYGIFDTIETAEKYLYETVISKDDTCDIVEINKNGKIVGDKRYDSFEIEQYVWFSDSKTGKFVKGFMQIEKDLSYYGEGTWIIVKTHHF